MRVFYGYDTDDYYYAFDEDAREDAREDAVRLEQQGHYDDADALRVEWGLPFQEGPCAPEALTLS